MSRTIDPNFDPYVPKPRPFLRAALDAAMAKIREDCKMTAVDLATTRDDPESLGQLAWVYEQFDQFYAFSRFRFEPLLGGCKPHPIRLPPSWRLAPDPVHGVVLLSTFGQRLTAAEAVGRFGATKS